MAFLYIKEHETMPLISGGQPQIWGEPAGTEQTPVAIGASSLQSAAFNARTKFITIQNDAICSYLVGPNPTATTSSFRLPVDQVLTIAVTPGHKIAVIANT